MDSIVTGDLCLGSDLLSKISADTTNKPTGATCPTAEVDGPVKTRMLTQRWGNPGVGMGRTLQQVRGHSSMELLDKR